jgi:hypothetical protein
LNKEAKPLSEKEPNLTLKKLTAAEEIKFLCTVEESGKAIEALIRFKKNREFTNVDIKANIEKLRQAEIEVAESIGGSSKLERVKEENARAMRAELLPKTPAIPPNGSRTQSLMYRMNGIRPSYTSPGN